VKFSSDPIAGNFITFSADKVAIVSTTYTSASNQIVFEFKRGKRREKEGENESEFK
jgi:hypothetical protein